MKRLLGFTLIEFMIVLAILGILAAIAIPALDPERAEKEKQRKIEAMITELSNEIKKAEQDAEIQKIVKMVRETGVTVEQAMKSVKSEQTVGVQLKASEKSSGSGLSVTQ